jgi:hypothetical protein
MNAPEAESTTVTPAYQIETLEQVVRAHLAHALELFGWHMTRTAEALSVDRRTLYRMIERHKLVRPEALPPEPVSCIGCGKLAPASDRPLGPGIVWACSPACTRPPVAEASP